MPDEEDDLLTPAECASLHGIRRQAINDAISRGKLKARRVGRHYAITRRDCLDYKTMEVRQQAGLRGAAERWREKDPPPPAEPKENAEP
jgi:excisionase family DNA binding protein